MSAFFKGSIRRKIFIYMTVFSIVILTIVGGATKFILPSYYQQKQVERIESTITIIEEAYKQNDNNLIVRQLEQLEENLGGDLYVYDELNGHMGYGYGKMKNRMNNMDSERFQPEGDITIYRYVNKIGLDIQVIGVFIEEDYLVYEVGIQSLNKAINSMLDFIAILLVLVLMIAILFSYIMSRTISKPIRDLNQLAEAMKAKKVEPYKVSKGSDEIDELNQTLNELYEELRGNIYKLDTELNKERNAERLKKRFLAQATHELKTPIAIIKGYAEILYDGMYKDEEERDRYLKNIYDETESVSRLIIDVLDYTKMETGNYQLLLADIEVDKMLTKSFERHRDFVENEGIEFVLETNIQQDFVKKMDFDRYNQIYNNLISNAVEHAEHKIITRLSTVGVKLKLSVYNDGPLIAEEDLSSVFESFYKAAGKKTGTGLGLAIVKEITNLHKGEYRVENTEDGVNFVIII